MSWLLGLLAAWLAVALVLAVVIGAAVRLAEVRRPRPSTPACQGSPAVPDQSSKCDSGSAAKVPVAGPLNVVVDEPVRRRTPAIQFDASPGRQIPGARSGAVRQQAH
jgi:hypothetical protein